MTTITFGETSLPKWDVGTSERQRASQSPRYVTKHLSRWQRIKGWVGRGLHWLDRTLGGMLMGFAHWLERHPFVGTMIGTTAYIVMWLTAFVAFYVFFFCLGYYVIAPIIMLLI